MLATQKQVAYRAVRIQVKSCPGMIGFLRMLRLICVTGIFGVYSQICLRRVRSFLDYTTGVIAITISGYSAIASVILRLLNQFYINHPKPPLLLFRHSLR